MQELLFENPVIVGSVGMVCVAIAAFVWTQTGHKAVMYSGIGLLVLTLVLVFLNIQIETDREEIRQILDRVASALRSNDHEQVFEYFHPNAAGPLQRVRRELPNYKFEEARVTGIKQISVDASNTPPTAMAEFFARVKVSREMYKGTTVRFLRVYFMERDGRWLVRDYEHYEPNAGFRDNSLTQPAL